MGEATIRGRENQVTATQRPTPSRQPQTLTLLLLLLLTLCTLIACTLTACTPTPTPPPTFPTKPIRIIVYTGPGGLIDVTARRFAAAAGRHVDTTFVVENKPGAGGLVALNEMLRTPADGYTLFAGTASVVAKVVETGRGQAFAELDWVARLMADPECVIVRASGPTGSWAQLVADARARPGEQLWVGPAAAGLDHVMAMKVWDRAGLRARWIPYESGGKALAALLGGHGAAYVGNPGEALGNPELAVAAVSAPARLAAFPGAPTFGELGVKGLDGEAMWRGFALRRGTPAGPRAWYAALFATVAQDPQWRQTWEPAGIDATYGGPTVIAAQVAQDRAELERYLARLSGGGGERGAGGLRGGLRGGLAGLGGSGWGGAAMALLVLLGMAGWGLAGGRARGLAPGAFAVPLLLVALGGVLLLASLALPGSEAGAGPAAMPRVWLGLLVPVAGVLLVQALLRRRGDDEGPGEEDTTGGQHLPAIGRQGPLLLVVLGAYVLGVWALGYFVATLVFLVGALALLGERRAVVVVAVACGWLGLAWLVLVRALDVPLPGSALLGLLTGGGA